MSVMLGVDVGGTKMAFGLVRRDGSLVGEPWEEPTRTESSDAFVGGLVAAVRGGLDRGDEQVAGVGLGCAGTVDWGRGAVIESPNLPIADLPLAGLVSDSVGVPVVLDNDANVATWAEVRAGCARGLRHVVMLTLGTGVGGGLVLDGRLYRGATGCAGELGHTIVMAEGDLCACGRRGCLERYASGTALERFATEIAQATDRAERPDRSAVDYGRELLRLHRDGELNGETVGRLAQAGDPAALDAVRRVARWLGLGLANLANIFNPEMIVVGGGLSSLGDLLLEPARAILQEMAIAPNKDVARVAKAELGTNAGVVGAALVAWEELGARR